MSCLTKSQFKHPGNNEQEKFFLTDNNEDNDDFEFQHVPVNQFKNIIKDVRRQRIHNEEEIIWTSYLKEQEESILNYETTSRESKYKSGRTLAESIQDVDRELLRLEADALPETHIYIDNDSMIDIQEKNFTTKCKRKNLPITKDSGTGSTNFLLTIPEEENNCAIESPDLDQPCRTFIRKSCSDQSFRSEKIPSRCYHCSSNNLSYNSSPEYSPHQYSGKNNSIPVRPDPFNVTKILSIQRKISIALDSIAYELDRIPLPDGEDDLHRRQQRVIEFSTRLSRNYLYDLGRQILEIQRHVKAISPNDKIRLSRRGIIFHMQIIEQKLISSHQLLLTALNAYWKHIPSSVLKNHPGKLKDILQIVVQLKNICTEIKLNPEFYCSGDEKDAFLGKETENRCSAILSKFRVYSDNESQVPSHTTRSTVITPAHDRNQRNRKKLTNRLSMYTMDMRLAKNYRPKKSYSMFQISKDKKQNCLASKQQTNIMPGSKKLRLAPFTKPSNETIGNKTTKISVPLKEDDIQTIMETVPSDLDAGSHQSLKPERKCEIYDESQNTIKTCETTHESRSLCRNRINYGEIQHENGTREKQFSTLFPIIGDLLTQIQNIQSDSKLMPSSSIDALYNFLQNCQLKVTSNEAKEDNEMNAKNMRLICYSAKEENESRKEILSTDHKETDKLNDAACQVSNLKNNRICNLSVSESARVCLMDYRNQYHNSIKSNPMYTSNTQNKPWEVVAWIADKLVDELIVELSDDFEMKDVIQQLLELELQEY